MTKKQMRIMLGYNAYFTADKVLEVAKEHVRAFNAEFHIVTSVVGHSMDETGKLANEAAQSRLDRLQASLEREGIPYKLHLMVREKSPGEDLVKFAEENDMDEMVVGFKRRSAIGEIVFGSNYRHMIGHAPCPIVTVKI